LKHPLHNRAIMWLLIATLLWAVSFPFVKILYIEQQALLPGVNILFLSILLMASRFGIACALLLPWVLTIIKTFTAREWRQGLWLALFGGAGMWLQADALAYTKASTCAFLTQGYCVFLPIYHALRTRRSPSAHTIIAVLMVVIGVAWLSGVKPGDLALGRGEWQTLLAALIFTMQILCLENPRFEGNRSLPVMWIMFFGIALFAVPCSFALAEQPKDIITALSSPAALALIATMAIVCSIGAYGLMIRWQSFVSSVEAGLIYCAEPLFTSVIALFLPAMVGIWMGHPIANEALTTALLGGGILITLANILLQSKPATAHSHHPTE
jgi:drug/metabolite transporter (DMT)-like permease